MSVKISTIVCQRSNKVMEPTNLRDLPAGSRRRNFLTKMLLA